MRNRACGYETGLIYQIDMTARRENGRGNWEQEARDEFRLQRSERK